LRENGVIPAIEMVRCILKTFIKSTLVRIYGEVHNKRQIKQLGFISKYVSALEKGLYKVNGMILTSILIVNT
jgi:hypothetical protein